MPLLAQSIGLDTLSKYFHLPINDVAKELGVCATVLKKICRKNGIPRWPHRKIKSLDKMIATLEASVAKNPEDEERIRQEIQTLRNKRLFLMKNPNVLAAKPANLKKSNKPQQSKRVNNNKSFDMMNPSIVLNPMAAALYTQLSQPYIPQPIPVPIQPIAPSCPSERLQWVPGDHPSAFVPTKALRQQQQQLLLQQTSSADTDGVTTQEQHIVSQSVNEESCAVPERIEFPIHLPELRISADGKPKLATLEPELFPISKNIPSPKKETPPSKWQLPEWFENEHKQIMLKAEGTEYTEDSIDIQVPTAFPSSLSPPSPLSTSPSVPINTDTL